MKHKYLPLIITALMFTQVACKKDGNKYPIVGKWQETKLRLYAKDSAGAFLYDTTYFQPFTSADFIQFNNNNTCIIGTDYYYYANPHGQAQFPPQKIPAITSTMNYAEVGFKYVLTSTSQSILFNPADLM